MVGRIHGCDRCTSRTTAIALASSCVLALAAAVSGCAATAPGAAIAPSPQQSEAELRAGFEIRPVRSASALLTPDQLAGPFHRVGADVLHDGRDNVYSISSDFGDFEAVGDEQLAIRLREIDALAAMEATSKTATFAAAAGRALTSPFVATWNLVTHPVDSIRGIPVGAWDAINHAASLAGGSRSEFEDNALASVIGFETRKRRLAADLGVDPYSSNKVLQKQLNRLAWAAYAGSLPSMFVPFVRDGVASEPNEDRLSAMLRDNSPEDLRKFNRIELAVMGVPEPLADQFVGHRWYSPRRATVLVASLAAMDLAENRIGFIEAAITAESEVEAQRFTETARLLRAYNDGTTGVRAIVGVDGQLLAYSDDQSLVLPMAADYAIWSRATADAVRAAQQPLPDRPVTGIVFEVAGSASERVRSELQSRGIALREHVLDPLHGDLPYTPPRVETAAGGAE